MLTDCPPRRNRTGALFRSLVEKIVRLLMGEPFILVPQRQVERLRQLERREELQMAERRGDVEYLDRELAKVQLTSADLAQSKSKTTPISRWPEEDFEGCVSETTESQELHGTGI